MADPIGRTPYPKYRFVVLGFLGLANILNALMMLSLGILLPSISEDMGLSPSQQGWLGASALVGNLVFAMPSSLWATRFRAKTILTIIFFAGALFVILQAWAPVFAILVLGRILFGAIIVVRQPARAVLTAQWFPPREVVLVNGIIFNLTFGIASILGTVVTAYLLILLDDSWRTTLTIFSIVFLVVGIIWALVGRDHGSDLRDAAGGSGSDNPLRRLLKRPEMWYLGVGMLGMSTAFGAIITFWPTLLMKEHDISLTTSGLLLGLDGVAEGAGGLALSFFLVRWKSRDMRKMLVAGLALSQVFTALGMVTMDSVPILMVLAIVHGLGFANSPILFTVPFELPGVTHGEVAVAAGFVEMASRSGGVLGPIIAGLLQEATGDLQLAMTITSLCALSMAIGAFGIFGKRHQRVIAPSVGD